jgi:hypothetical protein
MPVISESGLQWIKSSTGGDSKRLEEQFLRCSRICWGATYPVHSSNSAALELPDKGLAYKIFGALPDSFYQLGLSILDRIQLSETIESAHQPLGVGTSQQNISARACLFAAFAVVSYLQTSEVVMAMESKSLAETAQHLLHLVGNCANLEVLQALLLLVRCPRLKTLSPVRGFQVY